MIDGATLERGMPDREALLDLLNTSYGWWGDESVLRWTYDEYPGFEEEHGFYITVDGELAAFRRVFEKEIVSNSRPNYYFFVLGDTCVAPDHRGKGMYSTLHAETTDYCERQGGDLSCTFNRIGNLTYEANLDRGWQYRILPIRLRLFSPAKVIPKYADMALGEDSLVASILERFDGETAPTVGDTSNGTDSIDGAGSLFGSKLAELSNRTIATLVETASSTDPVRTFTDRLSEVRDTASTEWTDRLETHVRTTPLCEETVSAIEDLYSSLEAESELWFKRGREEINHMLSHPNLEAVVVVREGRLLGAAPLCIDRGGAIDTARVLDVVASHDAAARSLMDRVETVARDQNVDTAIAIAERQPGPRWAQIEQQVMMWDRYGTDTNQLSTADLHVGLYDVV